MASEPGIPKVDLERLSITELTLSIDVDEALAAPASDALDEQGAYFRLEIYEIEGRPFIFWEGLKTEDDETEYRFAYRLRDDAPEGPPPALLTDRPSIFHRIAAASLSVTVMCSVAFYFDLGERPDATLTVELPILMREAPDIQQAQLASAGEPAFDLITAFSGAKVDEASQLFDYTFDFSRPAPNDIYLSLDFLYIGELSVSGVDRIVATAVSIAERFVSF